MPDLILPGHPLFDISLAIPPPGGTEIIERHNTINWINDTQLGILRAATPDELIEYLEGGEYDEATTPKPVWDEIDQEWLYFEEDWEESEEQF